MSHWRSSKEYRTWRVQVIRRDKQCVICGSKKHRHAHHINSASYFPEQRFDVDNGVCLCSECHTTYHTDFNRSYKVKVDRYNFENFLKVIKYIKDKLCIN